MNGARAEPSVKMISKPRSRSSIRRGASHHFFRILMKAHSSAKMLNLSLAVFKKLKAPSSGCASGHDGPLGRIQFPCQPSSPWGGAGLARPRPIGACYRLCESPSPGAIISRGRKGRNSNWPGRGNGKKLYGTADPPRGRPRVARASWRRAALNGTGHRE